MMYWYSEHMTGWGYGLGIISLVLFWSLLIVAVIAASRYVSRGRQLGSPPEPPASQPPSAEQLLAERFARGEIDADEYRQRLETLRQGEHSAAGTRS